MQSEQKKVSKGLSSDVVEMCSNFLRDKQPSGLMGFFTSSSYDEESKLIASLRTTARKSTQQQLLDKIDSVVLELTKLSKLSKLATGMREELQKLSESERTKEQARHEHFVLEQKIPDYYAILGVLRTATDREITLAYRAASKIYHPDKNVGKPEGERAEIAERFKAINEAYRNVGTPQSRHAYEETLVQQRMLKEAKSTTTAASSSTSSSTSSTTAFAGSCVSSTSSSGSGASASSSASSASQSSKGIESAHEQLPTPL